MGSYGDSIQEIDYSVGQVLQSLKDNGLDDDTLVMFSSDHGPWYQGSNAPFRGRKGESYEGGLRVPLIARFPGQISPNRLCPGVGTMMDILPTIARLAGAPLPGNPLDGIDIWDMMSGAADSIDRDTFLYFDVWNLQCARMGRWKLHVSRYNSEPWVPTPGGARVNLPLQPELFDLEGDLGEQYDVSSTYPQVVAQIRARIQQMLLTFPLQVRNAWSDTMRTPVEDTPVGARPTVLAP
jgi:arylsulfatase A